MKKTVYMIRRKSDGLFSTGGMTPSFNKNGKVWASLGNLKNHLKQAVPYASNKVKVAREFLSYKDCEIVALERVVEENEAPAPFEMIEYLHGLLEREAKDRANGWPGTTQTILYLDGTTKEVAPNANDNRRSN